MTTYDAGSGGAAALQFARVLNGYPYVYGGTWPGSGGTDCDGLWNWAYAQVGALVNRPTYLGYLDSPWDGRNGHEADPHELGDLLWIPGADPLGNAPGHVMGYVSPGRVFQAEMTGTLIGEYDYDTTVWSYRTRPALQLPYPPPPPPVPGSPADIVGGAKRPRGPIPILRPGVVNDQRWVTYQCQLLNAAKVFPLQPPSLARYGKLQKDRTIRYKRAHHPLHPDAVCGLGMFTSLGVK